MTDPIERIVAAVPASFFAAFAEQADAAYVEALHLTRTNFSEPEQSAMLGHHRHALLERGVRLAAEVAGIAATAEYTRPRGSRYTVVRCDGVHLVRATPKSHRGFPRPAAFRATLARINAWMDLIQPDFFLPTPNPPAPNEMCAMLIVVPRRYGDISIPAWTGIAVPRSDLRGWRTRKSVDQILTHYAPIQMPPEPPVSIKDDAVPRIRQDTPKRLSDGQTPDS
jgi:hypothetical protein